MRAPARHGAIETPVLRDVAELHRPHPDAAWLLTCRGCDRDGPADDALWPCRTYTLVTRAVLGVSDVEDLLTSLPER